MATGLVRALDQLPKKTVTGPVMQLTGMTDRCPVSRLSGQDDLAGLVNLRLAGGHGLQDGANLVGVDAPHAGVTQLTGGLLGCRANGVGVLEFGDHAVRGHFAMGVAGARNLELGSINKTKLIR